MVLSTTSILWQSLSKPAIEKTNSDILLQYLKVLADLHSAAELKEAAVKFVVEHSEEFVDQVDDAFFKSFHLPKLRWTSSNRIQT